MGDTIITAFQLCGIGLSFGLGGPCLVTCLPFTLSLAVSEVAKPGAALRSLALFLGGRLCAYLVLGAAAGLSGGLLQRFSTRDFSSRAHVLAGILSIALSLAVAWNLWRKPGPAGCAARRTPAWASAGFFPLGFFAGIVPCGPLAGLLVSIALISKTALAGLCFAGAFGLGTCIAGAAAFGMLRVVLALPRKTVRPDRLAAAGQGISAVVLFGMGVFFVLHELLG